MHAVKPQAIRPIGNLVLARKYEKPERVGTIWLNPAWLQDNSRSLWEPVAYSEGALRWFRDHLPFEHELRAVERMECILVTAPNTGVHCDVIDDPKEHYFLKAEAVLKVIPFEKEEENDDRAS